MEKEEKAEDDQWELLPPNTSFLGLEDIKDLFSKEIDYIDYLIEQPVLIQSDQLDKPLQQVYDEDFVQQIKVQDPNQKSTSHDDHLKDSTSIDHEDKEDFNHHKPPCSDRRRRRRGRSLVAGIGELLSIGAAVAAAMVCGFLLGSGRRHEQQRFQIFTDDKANRINQVLVASASGMQPAAISFGGCFNDML